MIHISKLTPEDKYRLVVYRPRHGGPPEKGRITSWNDQVIFVDYTNVGRGNATPPECLEFV